MRWKDIIEAHHAYDNPGIDTQFQPLKVGDTVRVYHGFRDLPDAVEACARGLSGKIRAARVYSYESDNNPKGLFVTLSFKVATEFGGTIIEFVARSEDLEAPVWPGGSYTVQGQMSQYFGHGAKGRANRNQRRKVARQDAIQHFSKHGDAEHYAHIPASDDPLTASMLMTGREYQALFIGDLNPDQILAVYTRDENTVHSPYTKHDPKEFLAARPQDENKGANRERLFKPGDKFDGEAFIERINARYGGKTGRKSMEDTLKSIWSGIITSPRKTDSFVRDFGDFMWPGQYRDAIRWMKARWGKGE